MAERLWMATNSDGKAYMYVDPPRHVGYEFAVDEGRDFSAVKFDDEQNMPRPGECWEYVRVPADDAEAAAVRGKAVGDLLREIERLKAELAEARKMPACVEKFLANATKWVPDSRVSEIAAVRRHYAQPLTLSVGAWKLSNGTTCRVFCDGRCFAAYTDGRLLALSPDGLLDSGGNVRLVERIGE